MKIMSCNKLWSIFVRIHEFKELKTDTITAVWILPVAFKACYVGSRLSCSTLDKIDVIGRGIHYEHDAGITLG